MPTATDRPRTNSRYWMVAIGAALLMVMVSAVMVGFGFMNALIAKSMGVGVGQVMLYYSIMSLTGAIAMSALGPTLNRKLGTQRMVILAGIWVAVAVFAMSFAQNVGLLYGLGFVIGLAFPVGSVMQATILVNTWFEAQRGLVLGLVMAAAGVGGVLMGIVMPFVLQAGGWQLGMHVVAALCLICTVIPGVFLIRSHPSEVGLPAFGAQPQPEKDDFIVVVPGVPFQRSIRTRQFAALVGGLVLIGAIQSMQQHLAPILLERRVDLLVAGSLIAFLSLAGTLTTIGAGIVNDRRGTLFALVVCIAGQSLSMVGLWMSVGALPLALSITLFAIGQALPPVLVPMFVMTVFGPKDFVVLLGPIMSTIPVGMAFGAPLWGLVFDRTGSYALGLVVAALASASAGGLLAWAVRSGPALRRRVAAELGQTYHLEPKD